MRWPLVHVFVTDEETRGPGGAQFPAGSQGRCVSSPCCPPPPPFPLLPPPSLPPPPPPKAPLSVFPTGSQVGLVARRAGHLCREDSGGACGTCPEQAGATSKLIHPLGWQEQGLGVRAAELGIEPSKVGHGQERHSQVSWPLPPFLHGLLL